MQTIVNTEKSENFTHKLCAGLQDLITKGIEYDYAVLPMPLFQEMKTFLKKDEDVNELEFVFTKGTLNIYPQKYENLDYGFIVSKCGKYEVHLK